MNLSLCNVSLECWRSGTSGISLYKLLAYSKNVWLSDRVWQIYHAERGFAATNNTCEANNAALRRDVSLRCIRKVGALLELFFVLCQAESGRAQQLQTTPAFDSRCARRANSLVHTGFLRDTRLRLNSISFLLGHNNNKDERQIGKVIAIPATWIYDVLAKRSHEDLPATAQLAVETART
ncbi:hypothetical protein F441_08281 [Phytophthora nicotianae CJ01A1]|uniref:Uncharacterized protein n=3 Tax=Phytophthora nicotianae TaxID=4792 RepID=W2J5I2_PHYNI|nr:hypothetical protein L915_08131 [Phytophthora nicotianae]ETL40868.1 hypothetical protein L916_08052 [Phytophthora nicotianae]ETO76210.1 hypothetical protein F444_08361 [Phytophthora nicotianae P1976]ETP17314.1 hypothetical protein F441_08281 [Phytophthora nicotianae CJ01A1]